MNTQGIILAAGFSSRAGAHKMLLKLGKKTILEHCIEAMYTACSKIFVVGGYKIENLYDICSRYHKIKLVFNKNFSHGMFSSLREGLKYIDTEGFFFTPGDYPLIKSTTYLHMKKTVGEIVVPEFEGQRGHPVFMKSVFIDEILSSAKYVSLRDFISTKQVTSLIVDDPGILMDIDTMSDYQSSLQFYNARVKKYDYYNNRENRQR